MTIKTNKKIFLDNFLTPVSKINDNLSLDFYEGGIKTVVSSTDNSVALLIEIPCEVRGTLAKSIIPDCKSFVRLLNGIDDETPEFTIDNNNIAYKNKGFSFKYHLLDENYSTNKKSLNESKLKSIKYDTTFNISKKTFSDFLKFNSIVPDAEKIYFFVKDKKVYCRMADDQKSNINEVSFEISDSFEGNPLCDSTFVLNVQSLLLTSFTEELIQIGINHDLKIFNFKTKYISYIIFGLVK